MAWTATFLIACLSITHNLLFLQCLSRKRIRENLPSLHYAKQIQQFFFFKYFESKSDSSLLYVTTCTCILKVPWIWMKWGTFIYIFFKPRQLHKCGHICFIILFMVTQIDDAVVAFLSLTFFMTDITLRSY